MADAAIVQLVSYAPKSEMCTTHAACFPPAEAIVYRSGNSSFRVSFRIVLMWILSYPGHGRLESLNEGN